MDYSLFPVSLSVVALIDVSLINRSGQIGQVPPTKAKVDGVLVCWKFVKRSMATKGVCYLLVRMLTVIWIHFCFQSWWLTLCLLTWSRSFIWTKTKSETRAQASWQRHCPTWRTWQRLGLTHILAHRFVLTFVHEFHPFGRIHLMTLRWSRSTRRGVLPIELQENHRIGSLCAVGRGWANVCLRLVRYTTFEIASMTECILWMVSRSRVSLRVSLRAHVTNYTMIPNHRFSPFSSWHPNTNIDRSQQLGLHISMFFLATEGCPQDWARICLIQSVKADEHSKSSAGKLRCGILAL